MDLFSKGRFILGIGTGWLREETEIMGGDFPHRWTQTKESLLALKELWTKEEAEFHGKYYNFPPVKMYPKPMQKPHPPILIGGMAKRVFNRIVEVGDGWLPNRVTPKEIQNGKSKIESLCVENNRSVSEISITVYGQPADKQLITDFINAGADRVVVSPQYYETEKEMNNELEDIAQLVLSLIHI